MINKTHDLAYYEYLYVDAIKPAIAKGDQYVVDPCVWIAQKWSEDESLESHQPSQREALLLDLEQFDSKLFNIVMGGFVLISAVETGNPKPLEQIIDQMKDEYNDLLTSANTDTERHAKELEETINVLETVKSLAFEISRKAVIQALDEVLGPPPKFD